MLPLHEDFTDIFFPLTAVGRKVKLISLPADNWVCCNWRDWSLASLIITFNAQFSQNNSTLAFNTIAHYTLAPPSKRYLRIRRGIILGKLRQKFLTPCLHWVRILMQRSNLCWIVIVSFSAILLLSFEYWFWQCQRKRIFFDDYYFFFHR